MRVLWLRSDDPYANLAAEKYFFDEGDPAEEVLLLYINRPCVVYGRSQNPFAECDLRALRRFGIVPVRRYTGGGTVYHDHGNLNYTIIRPAALYDKFKNSKAVLDALRLIGIAGELNSRNDLLYRGRKFSGSAYRLTRARALHHGTVLISADLSRLQLVLRPSVPVLEARGVLSVASPVVRLDEVLPGLTVEAVAQAFIDAFGGGIYEEIPPDGELYRKSGGSAAALAGWEWLYGRTPRFSCTITLKGRSIRVTVENGRVVEAEGGDSFVVGEAADNLVLGHEPR